jgi:hypothetical protein
VPLAIALNKSQPKPKLTPSKDAIAYSASGVT